MRDTLYGRLSAVARAAARDYDFILMVATIVLAVLIGILFVGGTVYSFFAAQIDPAWTQTLMYQRYIEAMNSYLFPLLVALVLALGLCIPRRLFSKRLLLYVSSGILATTMILLVAAGQRTALVLLLAAAALIQLVVAFLTAARSGRLTYLQEGFLTRMGSALLHLGFVLLVGAFVIAAGASARLDAFWAATGLILVGMVMSLYSRELGRLFRPRTAKQSRDRTAV